MGKITTDTDVMWRVAPGGRVVPSVAELVRPELTPELHRYLHILGPTPKRCLETLADLGLLDTDIGRYFGIPSACVTDLRAIWKIDGHE